MMRYLFSHPSNDSDQLKFDIMGSAAPHNYIATTELRALLMRTQVLERCGICHPANCPQHPLSGLWHYQELFHNGEIFRYFGYH